MVSFLNEGLSWIQNTMDLENTDGQNWAHMENQSQHHVSDLGFSIGDLALTPEKLHGFLLETSDTWRNTPYLWDSLRTFDRWPDYRARFERDPERLRNLVVWMYFLHIAVEYLEIHPVQAETLALEWKDRPVCVHQMALADLRPDRTGG